MTTPPPSTTTTTPADDSLSQPQKTLRISHFLLLFCALLYCKNVFLNAAEACYVVPCYEGPGLEAIWKVNKGVTFTGESSGVFALFHVLAGLYLVVPTTIREEAHFLVGIFAGCTLCAALLSVNMVWVWGAEWNLLGDMTLLKGDNVIFEESGRHMQVNKPLIATFRQLSYLSGIMVALQVGILLQLLVRRITLIRQFQLLGGASVTGGAGAGTVGEMTPLQYSNSV